MTAETHPNPFQDAMGDGLQRAVQIVSCAVTAAQVYLHQQRTQALAAAERDERARRALAAQIRADREAARASWAPALDPKWLRQADLLQAARTWGAAMPYADRSASWYEPAAAMAMRKSEERLRDLHPHAMARYDRLRGDGMGPAEAMREAAPLFARPPRAHDTPYMPRSALDPGTGENLTWAAADPAPGPAGSGGLDLTEAQERRGRQIVTALQARACTQHRDPLGEAEQRTVLETITNLPVDVIERVVRADASAGMSRSGVAVSAASPAAVRTATTHASQATRPWENDFPVPIQAVVATAADAAPTRRAAPAPTPSQRHSRGDHPRS